MRIFLSLRRRFFYLFTAFILDLRSSPEKANADKYQSNSFYSFEKWISKPLILTNTRAIYLLALYEIFIMLSYFLNVKVWSLKLQLCCWIVYNYWYFTDWNAFHICIGRNDKETEVKMVMLSGRNTTETFWRCWRVEIEMKI